MNDSSTRPGSPSSDQRDALNDSEKRASPQPGSYKETETDEKIVGIPPIGPDDKPIRGLDPA